MANIRRTAGSNLPTQMYAEMHPLTYGNVGPICTQLCIQIQTDLNRDVHTNRSTDVHKHSYARNWKYIQMNAEKYTHLQTVEDSRGYAGDARASRPKI